MVKSCEYGRENRIYINELRTDISKINKGIEELSSKVTDLFNHQSSRLPLWATVLITILGSLVTGLMVTLVNGG
mgnify:CR=1 FL=1